MTTVEIQTVETMIDTISVTTETGDHITDTIHSNNVVSPIDVLVFILVKIHVTFIIKYNITYVNIHM